MRSSGHFTCELGLLIDDQNLTESVERGLREAEDLLFERVQPEPRPPG